MNTILHLNDGKMVTKLKAPSIKRLQDSFPSLSLEEAKLISDLAEASDDGDALKNLIYSSCPLTRDYAAKCHDPFNSVMWRRELMLTALNEIFKTRGVETIGPIHPWQGSAYEYCDTGNIHDNTLIFDRDRSRLTIGCPAVFIERFG